MDNRGFNVFVIFGATGDLVMRKVIPSLYQLFVSNQITVNNFKIFAFARRDFNNGRYNQVINDSLKKHFNNNSIAIDEKFYDLFDYVQGNLDDHNCFVELNKRILNLESTLKICSNKLFYLAIPPSLYNLVVENIKNTQFNELCKGSEVKVIVEKPFGFDAESSKVMQSTLANVFKENQIFRLDHYLGKNILRAIFKVREKYKDVWNTQNIERVFISTTEELGVEGRGEFFDTVGSLRDVGQNHLLEIYSLITMNPVFSSVNEFRESRANAMNLLTKYNDSEISKFTFRAQYKGYRAIDNVSKNSNTETYFKIAAFSEDQKWKNTKFIFEAGKRTGLSRSFVEIDFKNGEKLFINFNRENQFIRLFKGSNFTEIAHSDENNTQYVGEYSVLIEEALKSDLNYFVSQEEVEAQWRFVDPIINAWQSNKVPLFTYLEDDQNILSVSKI